ncbi:uncharacterized protein LOC134535261 [Bacillus rossius redtenbacheri]|uniref:uncharacterized protein LOC134535261 n=1 Tax=Bacillus rossius redtenbacheri TaxID=93214 RepID=UPI002FDDBB18
MCCALDGRTSRLGFVALLLLLGLAEVAAGSCLSYGHSCWGAHGKRSGARSQEKFVVPENAEQSVAVAAPDDARWFLAPLVDGVSGNEVWRSSEDTDSVDSAASRPLEDSAGRPVAGDIADLPADVVLMPAPDQQGARRTPHKLLLYKILWREWTPPFSTVRAFGSFRDDATRYSGARRFEKGATDYLDSVDECPVWVACASHTTASATTLAVR